MRILKFASDDCSDHSASKKSRRAACFVAATYSLAETTTSRAGNDFVEFNTTQIDSEINKADVGGAINHFDGDDPWWAIATQASSRSPSRRAAEDESPAATTPSLSDSPTPEPAKLSNSERTNDFLPLVPQSIKDTGVSASQIEALILKFLLNVGVATGNEVAQQLRLPFKLVSALLRQMKADQMVTYRGMNELNDHEHQLTPNGFEQAQRYSKHCTYFGSVPVALRDYIRSVDIQTLRRSMPSAAALRSALGDLVISPDIFAQIGQAVCSGKAMFLYGLPGNGKTSIAERVTAAFDPYVWIPRSISAFGEIIRLYDPSVHVEVELPVSASQANQLDHRWVLIRRPTIVAGGELTREQLEFTAHEATGIVEAPLHLKSNGGTLLIDDFGRQQISTAELLNRWIVPLEKGHDFLNLPSGRKLQIPFNQLLIFATNLEPRDLVDEAFLRRIPYKIEIGNPSEEEFRELFRVMAPKLGIEYRTSPVDYLIEKYYQDSDRTYRYCHPRDLLLQIRNFCVFHEMPLSMTNEAFDAAMKNYFSVM